MVSLPEFPRQGWGNSLENYLDRAVQALPVSVQREQRAEIEQHLREIAEEKMAQGQSREEAYRSAMSRFGKPEAVGRQIAHEIWQMTPFRRESSVRALQPVLLWCGLPVIGQFALSFAPYLPQVCPRKQGTLLAVLSSNANAFLSGLSIPLLLFMLLIMPVLLGIRLGHFDRKRIVIGWGASAVLLFAGGLLACLLNRADFSLLAVQSLLPTVCGLMLSLRIHHQASREITPLSAI